MGKAAKFFFDKRRLITATEKAERRVLNKFGSYVRQTARQSIRGTTTSRPGRPPGRKTGFLKRSILFAYSPYTSSVVIGPVRSGKPAEDTHALEYGGTTTNEAHGTKQRIAARPFMGPALRKELPQLPAMWRDSIK